MKTIFILFCSTLLFFGMDNEAYVQEIKEYQQELNDFYMNPEESPLSKKDLRKFKRKKGHQFFSIDEGFKIQANFELEPIGNGIEMATSTTRMAAFDIYGKASFTFEGEEVLVNMYRGYDKEQPDGYDDYLFFPFRDLTSGNDTYGVGRYIDIDIPTDNIIEIDFNKAYNPYCAYSDGYSCPRVPKENFINLRIEAGIMNPVVGH